VTALGAVKLLLAAQAASASVAGSVRDGVSGEPVPGVVVALTELDRSTVTDGLGRYVLNAVPPGPQHILARRIGYAPRTLHALVPRQGTVEINVTLHPQPILLGAIATRARVPVPGLDDNDSTRFPDRGLSIEAVRQHPLLAEPDVFQALGGGAVVLRPESPDGIHLQGGSADHVAYFLDGIPVFSPIHIGGTFSGWNPDALSHVRLETSSPAAAFPDALSGVVSAETRAPGAELRMQGSTSSTQARLTVDGPVGRSGAGYLVSLRSGFPGFPAPGKETSYLRGETGDWLATLESPLGGGRLRLLGYGSGSEMDAAAAALVEGTSTAAPTRHLFGWNSRSFGTAWARDFGRAAVHVRGWSAIADASALWSVADSVPQQLGARRHDTGLLAMVEVSGAGKSTTAGVRTQISRTSYGVGAVSRSANTPVTAAFLQHARWGRALHVELALVSALGAGDIHVSPRAELRWRPSQAVTVTGGYARLVQFGQSLRNAESVVGGIFPVDLYMGAGGSAVPVARSDQGTVAIEYRPAAGLRVEAQAYARTFDDLVLVAPQDGNPFATSGFVVGAGTAQGLALSVGASGARYGVVASYGLQRARRSYGDSSYVPDHGATHSIDAGVMVHPSATFSLRLAASGVLGRRGTALPGPFEWEACSLGDQGCEFAGSPRHRPGAVGAITLPAYVRVDLGVRKHWDCRVAGRDGLVAVFGTITNLLGRRNVLTVATDPATGERTNIEMRPRGPLVIGIDWRF
jgi:hypothetical protein